jgi:hypothetical protein
VRAVKLISARGTLGQLRPMNSLLTCDECGDVIGVYEPLVLVADDGARETSRAACPDVADSGEHYHRACYVERVGAGARDAPVGVRSRY